MSRAYIVLLANMCILNVIPAYAQSVPKEKCDIVRDMIRKSLNDDRTVLQALASISRMTPGYILEAYGKPIEERQLYERYKSDIEKILSTIKYDGAKSNAGIEAFNSFCPAG